MDQRITPCLMFKRDAEDAAELYVSVFSSVFGNSRILKVTYFGEEELAALRKAPGMTDDIMPGTAGSVRTVSLQLDGQRFIVGNGGAYFDKFSESMSIYVDCETQEQIDQLWERLSEGGAEQPCGWLKDKYGVSWQIAPSILWGITEGPDQEKSLRVMKAILEMKKIDIEKVMQAAEGR